VTIEGFSIDGRIYWTIWYSAWLHLQSTVTHTHTHTHTHQCPQSRLNCRCLVVAFKGGRSLSSGLSNSPRPQLPVSRSNSSPLLNPSSSRTHYLINQLTPFHWLTHQPNLLTHSLTHQPTHSLTHQPTPH
jgi:hypothetical protein